jgi:hypothetical protein
LLEAYPLEKEGKHEYQNFHKLLEAYRLKKGEVNPTKYQNLHESLEAFQLKKERGGKANKTPSVKEPSPADSFVSLLFTIANFKNIPQIEL